MEPVEFISANEEIAEVTSEGRVTGMLAGTTEIRVKTVNGVSNVCALTVKRSAGADYLRYGRKTAASVFRSPGR